MQAEARLREPERNEQTMVDTTSFSAAEQAMQQEFARLTQKLELTRMQLP